MDSQIEHVSSKAGKTRDDMRKHKGEGRRDQGISNTEDLPIFSTREKAF